jgi:serine/threonine-protein phosphatase 2A regulatory subunit B
MEVNNIENIKWKLNQVFGEDPTAVNEENIITTVEFDPTGDFLSIGYQCGQIVIFKRSSGDTFKFFTQFESHHPEFDFLTSLEIEEKINKIRWSKNKYAQDSRMLLSSNDKTIKLWKISDKPKKKLSQKFKHLNLNNDNNNNNHNEEDDDDQNISTPQAIQKKNYCNAHAYNINSISMCSDGELFMSADDLRINLWNLEISSECFTFVDIKPSNMNELTEVITSAIFHPKECHTFVYGSSKGIVYLGDMRQHAICDKVTRCFKETENSDKSFFSEVTKSISDVQFSSNGKYIVARDYLNLYVWDTAMETSPVHIFNIHDHLKSKLYELYENDVIFDKFECCFSHDDKYPFLKKNLLL